MKGRPLDPRSVNDKQPPEEKMNFVFGAPDPKTCDQLQKLKEERKALEGFLRLFEQKEENDEHLRRKNRLIDINHEILAVRQELSQKGLLTQFDGGMTG